jgi:hypothetical protein
MSRFSLKEIDTIRETSRARSMRYSRRRRCQLDRPDQGRVLVFERPD